MQNAKKFNDRITLGLTPSSEDIKQLKELGYKTLIDLRDTEEMFGGLVENRAREIGLNYIYIPVQRDAIVFEDVKNKSHDKARWCQVENIAGPVKPEI